MKIQKGHYVPKELITSEAIHESVVKCFVAAGFSDDRPFFGERQNMLCCHAGLAVSCNGKILWGQNGVSANNPLTLQQLFTAENGIAWPDFAVSIQANDTAVWFDDGKQPKEQFKVISSVKSHWNTGNGVTLAAHQPKDKEVNEALDKAVIGLKGKWPSSDCSYMQSFESEKEYGLNNYNAEGTFCTRGQFTQRAKELGFINGYRWGVGYQTNGKRPDLADDVRVCCFSMGDVWYGEDLMTEWNWSWIAKFKITDPRYKPQDTSYLNSLSQDQSLTHSEEGLTHSDWWSYDDGRIMSGKIPPIGSIIELAEETEFLSLSSGKITVIAAGAHCHVVGHAERPDNKCKCVTLMSVINIGAGFCTGNPDFLVKPLDHATRKAEMDKKRVIDAVVKSITEDKNSFIAEYEYWLDKKKPSGDCDDLQCKWLESRDYSECVDNLHFYISLAYDKGFIGLPDQK